MGDTAAPLLGMTIAAIVSMTVIALLHGRLRRVLNDLCGTPERGAFWAALTNVLVVLTTIAASLLPRYEGSALAEDGLIGLKWSLFGLIASLVVVASLIARFAAFDARKGPRPPGSGQVG